MSGGVLIFNLALAIAIIIIGIVFLKVNPAISMVIASLVLGVMSGFTLLESTAMISKGFGDMMMSIGLPIGLGVILGQLMSDTGAAERIAESIVDVFPEKRSIFAVGLAAFILSIPVFFDVTFIILIPIGIAIAKKINKPMPYITGAISIGAACAHGMVPPTPNPLAAGDIFGFSVGIMLVAGLVIGGISAMAALKVHSMLLDKGIWNPERDENHDSKVIEDLEKAAEEKNGKEMPSFFASMLPIIIPVFCILLGTLGEVIYGDNIPTIIGFFSDKLIALLLGTLASYILGYKYLGKDAVETSANAGLATAGTVLLVTGAGGSFGAVIKATDIGNSLVATLGINTSNVIVVLLFAYFVGFIFRVAQGSGTVAGITSMQIMANLAGSVPVHPVYIALACLAGGNSIGHVNDSGFWVATNLSGLTVTGGLKTYTLGIFLTTLFALILTIIAATIFPMVGLI